MDTQALLESYDLGNLTVGVLGGHSALDVCHGAKKHGFKTLAVTRKDREKTYSQYYKTREGPFGAAQGKRGCVDEIMSLEKFSDVLDQAHQKLLREKSTIFVHNRYFWVYFEEFEKVEKEFNVPIFGSRTLLKLEERDQPFNQYDLLRQAGIRTPRVFESAEQLNGQLGIVKAAESDRSYERAFFLVTDQSSWLKEGTRLEVEQKISKGWEKAPIEEFIVGAHVNFNFFYSPLRGELELLGTDIRRQTNLDGFLRMTADQQLKALEKVDLKMIETGHMACTIKESILEKAFEMGEKFVAACKAIPPELDPSGKGIIGPFALQGAVVAEQGKEDIVIFDVSFRIPGSPGLKATPYTGYLHGEQMSVGERIGLELREAVSCNCVERVIT